MRRKETLQETPLTYQELASKILPELHLLAQEAGIEGYKRMKKDQLIMALLERQTQGEGLRLVKGYLEISQDGTASSPRTSTTWSPGWPSSRRGSSSSTP